MKTPRRKFVKLSAARWRRGRSQHARSKLDRVRRIGVMISLAESDPEAQANAAALREGLEQLGWTEGRQHPDRLSMGGRRPGRARAAAKELLALSPDVIMPATTQMLAAVRQETGSVPVVFVNISDPVGTGFVESLARPGGNVTGFTNFEYAMGEKWLQTLKEIAPSVTRTAIIANPKNPEYPALPARDRARRDVTRAATGRDAGERRRRD